MTIITTTLVSGQNAHVGSVSSRGEYSISVSSGIQGLTGAVGDKGDKGDPGTNGSNGVDGIDGQDGAPGAAGANGINGRDGVDGAPGTNGAKGDTGNQGTPGSTGAQGAPGAKGDTGNTGAQGVSVTLQGTKALIADLPVAPINLNDFAGYGWIVTEGGGDLWFWNLSEAAWNNVGPLVGPQGDPGVQGPAGGEGAQGPAGADGTNGEPGANGVDGVNGVDGTDGAPGQDGVDGAQGPSGADGIDGVDGIDGALGPQGDPGTAAAFNFVGEWNDSTAYAKDDVIAYDGSSYIATQSIAAGPDVPTNPANGWQLIAARGTDGAPGPAGDQGSQGDPGPAGADGAPGPQGDPGPQGEQGPAGADGGADTGDFVFDATMMSVPDGDNIVIQAKSDIGIYAQDEDGVTTAEVYLDPSNGQVRLTGTSEEDSSYYDTNSWDTAVWTLSQLSFTNAPNIIAFLSRNDIIITDVSVNDGDKIGYDGSSSGDGNIGIDVNQSADPDPTTITSFQIYYRYESRIEIDNDDEELNIIAHNLDINIETTDNLDIRVNNDINIYGSDDFNLRNRSPDQPIRIITADSDGGNTWEFDHRGSLRLPAGGDIIDSSGQSVLGGNYTLPTASDSVLGGIKIGTGLSIDVDGVVTTAAGDTTVARQATPPTAGNGTLWFNTEEGRLYIKYNDVWVDAAPLVMPAPDTDIDVVSITFPDASVQTTAIPNKLVNGVHEVVLGANGTLTVADDIILPRTGRIIKDCDNSGGTTSQRWINIPTIDSEQLIQLLRVYTGDPLAPGNLDRERATISLEWQTATQSGLSITAFDRTDGTDVHKWEFKGDGNLELPGGQLIGGSDSNRGIAMTTLRGTVLFGGIPEVGPTGTTHFHIMKASSSTDLFFGDDNNYVKLPANNGGVEIGTGGNNTWAFDNSGDLTLPQGSVISETATTTIITPPGAAAGQSLVIRPTSVSNLTASGFIVPGTNLTITLTNIDNVYSGGPITYTITGATAQQLGIDSLTGTFPAFDPSDSVPQTTTVVLPIPEYTNANTFTFTVGGDSIFSNNTITVTDDDVIETSHVHLVAGNPTTTDIFLGDDNQYVKIAKNGGDIVVGTDSNTNHWVFGTDGNLTLPGGPKLVAGYPGQGIYDAATLAGTEVYLAGTDGANWMGIAEAGVPMIGTVGGLWTFGTDGGLTFPDDTVQTTAYTGITTTTVAKTVATTGPISAFSVSPAINSINSNWPDQDFSDSYLSNTGNPTNFQVVITGGELTNITLNSQVGAFSVGDTITINGMLLGATDGIDDIVITVTALDISPTALDLTKSINKLTDGDYILADGVEGQIMYLVRQNAAVNINISVANARVYGGIENTYPLALDQDIVTLIYTDGAWQQTGGTWD